MATFKPILSGVFTALVTPFSKDLTLDLDGLRSNVLNQVQARVNGVIALGTTGEAPTLTSEERVEVIKIVVEAAKGKALIGVGTGTNATRSTIELTRQAQELGADFALISAPYYNKPTQEGIVAHFKAISSACQLPIMVYNVPGRSGVNITPATLGHLAAIGGVIAIKESSGNVDQALDMLYTTRSLNNFSVLSGDDSLTLPLMASGAKGVVSVASNVVAAEVMQLVTACANGDFALARSMQDKLLPLMRALFMETNPQPVKAAMEIVGLAAGSCRLPLLSATDPTKEQITAALSYL